MGQVIQSCIAKLFLCAVGYGFLVLTLEHGLLKCGGPASLVPAAALLSDRQHASMGKLLPRVATETVDRADGDTKDVQGRGGDVERITVETTGEGGPEKTEKEVNRANELVNLDEGLKTVSRGLQTAYKGRKTADGDGLEKAEEGFNKAPQPGLIPAFDPNQRLLLRAFSGRLGNCLFELASAVCIAELNNLTLVIQDSSNLQGVDFKGIRVSDKEWRRLSQDPKVTLLKADLCCEFMPKLMKLNPAGHSFNIKGYLQSWRYFEPCKQNVLAAVRFNKEIVRKARAAVTSLRAAHPGRTLVGVHVRLEDFLDDREITHGRVTAPPEYYRKAMTFFRKRYDDVTFVVFTTQVAFFKENVTSSPDVVFKQRSLIPAVDVEILSGLDHLIISVGTFGWWAAYRSRGTVVCYRDFFVPGTKFGKQFVHGVQDFLYPSYVPM